MPSPFPGVDPYIEATGLWSDLHSRFIAFLASYLVPLIRPRYYPQIEKRVTVLGPDPRTIIPDVGVLERGGADAGPAGGASVAVAEAAVPVLVEEPEEEVRQGLIQIRDRTSGDRVVTQIEMLSPDNKSGRGRDKYLRKQEEILASEVHLVEIDLLRRGLHTIAVPEDLLRERVTDWDFLVSVNRSPSRWRHEVYPFRLPDPLPRIRLPLLSPDPDVVVDLQAVYNRCYDESPYAE